MHETLLIIEAREPLAFPESKPGAQFRRSLPFVPGAALFGALGGALWRSGRFDPALLRRLRCRNAYPMRDGDEWVRPLPATAITPKGESNPRDSLVQRVCWEQQRPPALVYAPTDSEGRPWEAAGQKFYTIREGKLEFRDVTQRIHTRVAINRRRGTAEDRLLYSFFAVNETTPGTDTPTSFIGSLVMVDPDDPAVWRQVTEIVAQQIDRLGARQTTGIGGVRIMLRDHPGDRSIRQRVEALTERFKQQIARYQALGGAAWELSGPLFTVNLVSDAILLRDGWLPTQELSADMLRDATGIEARLVRSFTTTRVVGGWHALWQRPKMSYVAVRFGSLYVFEAQRPLTDADYAALERLERDGIGERRQEGFGQVRICDDFHLIDWEGRNGSAEH
ncbi:MAG: CRISPR-associated RAMP protein Csx10 [Roseiflexus sp.]|nr:CRISPR-associated RAMP protein Csx10 [Roseiflexus sp.]MDW8234354.1 CRISPR-associated RAMP protein Csx10 [Roseiflexaceae bacterium]